MRNVDASAAPWAAGAFALWALASPAQAHLGHVIRHGERYLKVDASEADTRVVVSLTLGPEEGARVLSAADRDQDGVVSDAESRSYLEEWTSALRGEVPVELDGARVEVPWTEGYIDPIGPVRRVALTVEAVLHVPVSSREHVLIVRDRMARRETFDRTDVAFRAHDGAEVVQSGEGEVPSERETDFAFGAALGGPMPDAIVARVRFPARPESSESLVFVAGAVVVLTVGAVAWGVRRRRSARP